MFLAKDITITIKQTKQNIEISGDTAPLKLLLSQRPHHCLGVHLEGAGVKAWFTPGDVRQAVVYSIHMADARYTGVHV